ncbi:hypothetical protein ACIRRH_33020 [Kitasatospora sp. NPDC101235]|uniref:hypothetical protein n=1 Tax=Kitasatospora sp. NPDC101235 TaxID=3364101 RepID=UPI00381EA686
MANRREYGHGAADGRRSGGYQLVNASTNGCLTSEGIGWGARVAACSNAENQVWTLS